MSIPSPLTKKAHREQYPAIDPTNPANSAAGKTVAISGGTGGIGYLIARGFAKAGAAAVILLARRQSALDEGSSKLRIELAAAGLSTEVWTYLLDIRDKASTDAVFAALRDRVRAEGKGNDIDILVANAGDMAQGEALLDYAPETVRGAFDTNVFGNLNLVRAYLAPEAPAIPMQAMTGKVKDVSKAMAPGDEKIVLNVSTGVIHMRSPGHALYSSSKLAFTHMLKHLQLEVDQLPGAPVRIHSFNPGVIFTPGALKNSGSDKVLAQFLFDDESLPEGFTVWLASPAAAFLKGRFVWSSWDVEELVAMKQKFEEDPEFCQMTLKGL
ncbi:hypothetical protein B0J12DRAFT_585854 [Macrophomina phaseolina]|uniref:Short-chain dehydrogenase/reductase SDR n=1 Tax=Macrophomina phaseolina TaxID=35725 RepID=A0ABQ8FSL1_9PEZI|nr:hypothetical protein B0J12DRAFT_585854 [Macrophomina phaseolina]